MRLKGFLPKFIHIIVKMDMITLKEMIEVFVEPDF